MPYSYLIASSGGIFTARLDGYNPVRYPTILLTSGNMINIYHGRTFIIIKSPPFVKENIDITIETRVPKIKPNITPPIPPAKPINIDSLRKSVRISSDFIPIVFNKPISLVLSNNDTVNVLTIPIMAIVKATIPKDTNPKRIFLNKDCT